MNLHLVNLEYSSSVNSRKSSAKASLSLSKSTNIGIKPNHFLNLSRDSSGNSLKADWTKLTNSLDLLNQLSITKKTQTTELATEVSFAKLHSATRTSYELSTWLSIRVWSVQADRKFIKRATAKIAAHRHRNLHSDALDFLLAQFRPKLFPKKNKCNKSSWQVSATQLQIRHHYWNIQSWVLSLHKEFIFFDVIVFPLRTPMCCAFEPESDNAHKSWSLIKQLRVEN